MIHVLGRVSHAVGRPYFEDYAVANKGYLIVTKMKGPRGGGQLLVKKNSYLGSWNDSFRGNMENSFNILGDQLSDFLGFKRLSSDEILIPDAEELNRALQELNKKIVKPSDRISTTFYEPTLDRVPDREYALEYVFKNRLPVAHRGSEAVHDINFHLAGAFMPEVMVAHLRRHYQTAFEFEAFLNQYYPKTDNKIAEWGQVKNRLSKWIVGENDVKNPNIKSIQGVSSYIDFFTALVGDTQLKFPEYSTLAAYMPPSLLRKQSPEDFLREQFERVRDPDLKLLLDRFIKIKRNDPSFTEKYNYSFEENKKLILERVRFIRGLVEK